MQFFIVLSRCLPEPEGLKASLQDSEKAGDVNRRRERNDQGGREEVRTSDLAALGWAGSRWPSFFVTNTACNKNNGVALICVRSSGNLCLGEEQEGEAFAQPTTYAYMREHSPADLGLPDLPAIGLQEAST